jgi:hypothetical protein
LLRDAGKRIQKPESNCRNDFGEHFEHSDVPDRTRKSEKYPSKARDLRSLQRVQQRHSGIEKIGTVVNMAGEEVSDNAGIAEAFAQFYEDLYREGVETTAPEE